MGTPGRKQELPLGATVLDVLVRQIDDEESWAYLGTAGIKPARARARSGARRAVERVDLEVGKGAPRNGVEPS
jgi:hypothetical protein